MRRPKYLSNSALSIWQKDPKMFCQYYLAESRMPRQPQTSAMSVGSSFDAWVKSALHATLFGPGSNPEYEFDAIFTSQVDAQNRDFAHAAGLHCFDEYVLVGAYDELLELLKRSDVPPRFEFSVQDTFFGVPLLGKPDCYWSINDIKFLLDWKVKGYCSEYSASPSKGYSLVRQGQDWKPDSRNNGKAHKSYVPMDYNGHIISSSYMEDMNKDYAAQLALYGWLMGNPIGDENCIYMIDELCCKPKEPRPLLRIANLRARISETYQHQRMAQFAELWTNIQDEWIFRDLSKEESQDKVEMYEYAAIASVYDDPEFNL